MSISGKLFSPLYLKGGSVFETEVKGFNLQFQDQQLTVFYPDGQVRTLPKLEDPPPSTPLALLYTGQLEEAEQMLSLLKRQHPESQFWKDHSLSNLALETYMDFKTKGKLEEGRVLAREILQMAIRLNPQDHDFSEFSLRFY